MTESNSMEFSITLRITSERLSTGVISNAMGHSPTRVIEGKNDLKTLWLLELEGLEGDSPEEVLAKAFEAYTDGLSRVKKLGDDGTYFDIFCLLSTHSGQAPIALNVDLMRTLSDAGVDLAFDVYFLQNSLRDS